MANAFRDATREELVGYLESGGFGVSDSAYTDELREAAEENEALENNE